ncbi:MAG: rubredoxin [Candidatus Woesearchaeota archaeon]
MAKYECATCGFIYDEKEEGTLFSELPDDWICPVCSSPKSDFYKKE